MATKTKGRKGGSTKASAKTKAKSSENGGRKRASQEELDELAAEVVRLRDEERYSWGDLQEELDLTGSRARSLYNRGGGTPGQFRSGAKEDGGDEKPKSKAKGGTKGKGKSSGKGKGGSRPRG